MPRPRLPGMVSAPKSTLERYPDHVQAIGMITIEIGNMEIMFGELLGALLHIDAHYGRVVYLTPKAAIARLDIVQNVLDDTLVAGSDGRKTIQKLIDRAKAVIGKRHQIHDAWGVAEADPGQVVRRPLPFRDTHPAVPVPLAQLTDLIADIRELADDVRSVTAEAFVQWPPYTSQSTKLFPTSEGLSRKAGTARKPRRHAKKIHDWRLYT